MGICRWELVFCHILFLPIHQLEHFLKGTGPCLSPLSILLQLLNSGLGSECFLHASFKDKPGEITTFCYYRDRWRLRLSGYREKKLQRNRNMRKCNLHGEVKSIMYCCDIMCACMCVHTCVSVCVCVHTCVGEWVCGHRRDR